MTLEKVPCRKDMPKNHSYRSRERDICHRVKIAVLILATIGLGTMDGCLADVGVTVLAVLNAMRSLGKNRLFLSLNTKISLTSLQTE